MGRYSYVINGKEYAFGGMLPGTSLFYLQVFPKGLQRFYMKQKHSKFVKNCSVKGLESIVCDFSGDYQPSFFG